jgi:hypothetical protein
MPYSIKRCKDCALHFRTIADLGMGRIIASQIRVAADACNGCLQIVELPDVFAKILKTLHYRNKFGQGLILNLKKCILVLNQGV